MTATEPKAAASGALDGLLDAARAIGPETLAIRRRLHRHPEIGLALPETQEAIVDELDRLGVASRRGSVLTSVVAVIDGERPGPSIVLRADMDALPLHEDTDLDFASEIDGRCTPAVTIPTSRCFSAPPGCSTTAGEPFRDG